MMHHKEYDAIVVKQNKTEELAEFVGEQTKKKIDASSEILILKGVKLGRREMRDGIRFALGAHLDNLHFVVKRGFLILSKSCQLCW